MQYFRSVVRVRVCSELNQVIRGFPTKQVVGTPNLYIVQGPTYKENVLQLGKRAIFKKKNY